MQVITELKNRGVQDILFACVDGLKGFPDMTLRKVIENREMFPSDGAVFKILYLALKNISKNGQCRYRIGAMNQFAILFEDRLPGSSFNNSSFTQIFYR